jgi:hypothetical protein
MIADKAYYLTELNDINVGAPPARVVLEGDPEARFLLVGKGGTISDDEAARYGIPFGVPEPEVKAVEEPPENKAIKRAPRKKAK